MTSAKPQSQSHEPHESQKTQSPYAQLFRIPGTKAFCVSGAIARLPMSMMGLGIVLALNHMYDNWTIAGVMSAAYVLATAAVTPLYARLFDRFGQRKVGPVILTVQIIVMLGFAFAALMRVPIPLLFVLAVVMGMTQFSFGALVRTRWAYVLDRADKEDLLNTAYALESAIDEIVFIFGPILAAFLAASVHPVSQLFVPTLACAFGGAVFFALRDTQPPVLREITVVAAGTDDADVRLAAGGAAGAAVSADRFDLDRLKTGDRDRRKRNVLTYAGVLPLLAVFIVFNMAFTAFDTSMTAVMKSLHLDSVLGVQLAMLAVGSCMGALVFRLARAQRLPLASHDHVPRLDDRRLRGDPPVPGQPDRDGTGGDPHRPDHFAGIRLRQPPRQGDRARGIAHRRPVLGEHRRHNGRVVRLHDHRHRARPFQSKRGIEPARRVRGLFDSVRADWLAAGASKRLFRFVSGTRYGRGRVIQKHV